MEHENIQIDGVCILIIIGEFFGGFIGGFSDGFIQNLSRNGLYANHNAIPLPSYHDVFFSGKLTKVNRTSARTSGNRQPSPAKQSRKFI